MPYLLVLQVYQVFCGLVREDLNPSDPRQELEIPPYVRRAYRGSLADLIPREGLSGVAEENPQYLQLPWAEGVLYLLIPLPSFLKAQIVYLLHDP